MPNKPYNPLPSEGDALLYDGDDEQKASTLSCCEQGGCCRHSPPRLVRGPDGSVVRVNLLVKTQGCCGAAAGLRAEDQTQAPIPLANKMSNTAAWEHWVGTELRCAAAQPLPSSPAAVLCLLFATLSQSSPSVLRHAVSPLT